jgi:hypothetical protein
MNGRHSLWLASSLADDARRRAARTRRSAGYRIEAAVKAESKPAPQRGWIARILRPATGRPNAAG